MATAVAIGESKPCGTIAGAGVEVARAGSDCAGASGGVDSPAIGGEAAVDDALAAGISTAMAIPVNGTETVPVGFGADVPPALTRPAKGEVGNGTDGVDLATGARLASPSTRCSFGTLPTNTVRASATLAISTDGELAVRPRTSRRVFSGAGDDSGNDGIDPAGTRGKVTGAESLSDCDCADGVDSVADVFDGEALAGTVRPPSGEAAGDIVPDAIGVAGIGASALFPPRGATVRGCSGRASTLAAGVAPSGGIAPPVSARGDGAMLPALNRSASTGTTDEQGSSPTPVACCPES